MACFFALSKGPICYNIAEGLSPNSGKYCGHIKPPACLGAASAQGRGLIYYIGVFMKGNIPLEEKAGGNAYWKAIGKYVITHYDINVGTSPL